ncbi:hypothetical protein [Flavobacterium sp.]|uniref:hypothetical protein n=1 Tax=Flavobacterium sp. TaxID=239 RepID=UPI00286D7B01|nr:hypothetical protein [Flavobacterium sp.]
MNRLFCLIKFGRKEHLEKLIGNGQLRFGAIDDFQKSTEKGRGDKFEGLINISNVYFSKIECEIPNFKKFTFQPMPNKLFSITNYTTDSFYSFSSYALTSDNFKETDIHKIDERMSEFGDYALVIEEPILFLNEVKRKLTEMNIKFGYQLTDYKDYKQEGTFEANLFSKTLDLEYQCEHRILINTEQNEKEVFIEIVSIKEFCSLIKADEILNIEFKANRLAV